MIAPIGVVGLAGSIASEVLITNVARLAAPIGTSALKKVVCKMGGVVVSTVVTKGFMNMLRKMNDQMLAQYEKAIGLEIVGYIDQK